VTPWAAAAAVAAGGALGALLRWGVALATARWTAGGSWAHVPLGTVVVNVVGCFALAWLLSAGAAREGGSSALRLFLGTGLLGALTTFSTFGLDAHGLALGGRPGQAVLYVGGTLLLAGAAVLAGWALGR
jgi:CrcB protein